MEEQIKKVEKEIKKNSEKINNLISEISKVIVGQKNLIDRLIIALLTNGHILLEGVPGLAKTKSILTFSQTCGTSFQRIQFTPDLLPSDLIGNKIFNQKDSTFSTKKGPIFANFILADEINRSPAKVQSALLEVMQERQVTIQDQTFILPKPFLVLATQNPIEQEGTYPLPEAQIDRFLLKVKVDYPSEEEELQIMNLNEKDNDQKIRKILSSTDILKLQQIIKEIYVDDKIKEYIKNIIFKTRENNANIEFGASPRASIALLQTSKVIAFLNKRAYVIPEDIKEIALDVLRHRVIPTYEAEAENITSEDIIKEILNQIQVP